MPRANPIQASFARGEISSLLHGRVDLEPYAISAKTILNGIVRLQGPVMRRSGSRFVAEAKDSTKKIRLVSFEFSTTQAYVIEFGDQYLRFYMNDGRIESPPGTPIEIVTPYLEDDLFGLKFAQSADTLYIAHPSYAPRKLTRSSHTSWSLSVIAFSDGPYLDENTGAITLAPSGTTVGASITIAAAPSAKAISNCANSGSGLIRVTSTGHGFATGDPVVISGVTGTTEANGKWTVTKIDANTLDLQKSTFSHTYVSGGIVSANIFAATDIGRLVRIKHGSTWGYAAVTAYTNEFTVTAEVKVAFGATTAQTTWRLGSWSQTTGYPGAVTFYEQRLWWAGNTNQPQTIWSSKSSDFENMAPTDGAGVVTDANAINFTLGADQVNVIRWLNPGQVLQVGTVGGLWILRASTLDDPLTPSTVQARRQRTTGCANVAPKEAGDATLFVTRSGRKVRELAFAFERDKYVAPDMTVFAEHIGRSGITVMAFAQEPDPILWCVRNDGTLIGLTYERDQEVTGWHRHVLGGSFAGGPAIAESVATIPGPNGDRDEVWLSVKRTINGQTTRYVEFLEAHFSDETAPGDAYFVDAGLTYSGVPASTISGLSHLEGETVAVLADGAAHPDKLVTAGQIMLDRAATKVHVGLPYNTDIESLRLEAGAVSGTAQGQVKRIAGVTLRFLDTLGCQVGPDASTLDDVVFRDGDDPMDQPPPIFSGDKYIVFESGYGTDATIFVRQAQPLPMTLQAIMPRVNTSER